MYLLTAALIQNFVLTTGFGSSLGLRLSRRASMLLPFGALLTVFAAVSVVAVYPLDAALGTSHVAKHLRPLVIVAVVAVLYAAFYGILKLVRHPASSSLRKMLPTVAFNNLTVGILLIVNHQFALPLGAAVALAVGVAVGFTLLSQLLGYLRTQLDHPMIPVAFRGLPILLISLGLLTLGLMGFSTNLAWL